MAKRALYEVDLWDGRKVKTVADGDDLEFEGEKENTKIKNLIIKIMYGVEREMWIFPFGKVQAYRWQLINEEEYIVEKGAKEWTIKSF